MGETNCFFFFLFLVLFLNNAIFILLKILIYIELYKIYVAPVTLNMDTFFWKQAETGVSEVQPVRNISGIGG